MSVNPSDVTPKVAIDMLRLGVDAERLALGLGDAAPNMFDNLDDNSALQEAVQAACKCSLDMPGLSVRKSVNAPLQFVHVDHTLLLDKATEKRDRIE
jgi:hypothetical protein